VLRRLAVFAGGFRLESAQRVAGDATLDRWAVTEALSGLVDRSIVQVNEEDPPRYRLLESVRLYACEKLEHEGELGLAKGKHMDLMAEIGNEVESAYWVTPDEPWLARYAPEYDDLQSAFNHATGCLNAEAGAATLDALYRLDELRGTALAFAGRLPAARRLLAHAAPSAASCIHLALASLFVAQLVVDDVSKLAAAQRAVELARSTGDTRSLYRGLMAVVVHGTIAGHENVVDDALSDAESLEQPSWPARLKWFGAIHRTFRHVLRGDAAAAMAAVLTELEHAEQAGSAMQSTTARANAADIALMCGNVEEAIRLGREVVDETRALGLDNLLGTALTNLCAALIAARDLTSAREVADQAIHVVYRHERWAYLLDHLSFLAAQQGHYENSAMLIGFTDAWWSSVQYAREGNEAVAVARAMALNEQAIGIPAAALLRKQGASLDRSTARELAFVCLGFDEESRRLA
jgi:hypothetical protein